MRLLALLSPPALLSLLLFSQPAPGLSPFALDAEAEAWVKERLSHLSLEEKVGQLIVAGTETHFTHVNSEKFQEVRENIQRYRVGGYHAFQGEVLSAALLIRRMQELASLPLLITADLEGGAGLIFEGATRFPKAMALAAAGDPDLVYQTGRITAEEAARIGVHVNFYPVVDVNNNPENPIINIRSFGEDPRQVATLAEAYIRGVQEHGLLATAKHFPGHGDTAVDSHLELPVIEASRERIQTVELVPFRAAIRAGVGGIMTAHLAVPALEPQRGLPASLSAHIQRRLLRRDLGFQGLVFTDAMSMMGGIVNHYSDGEGAVAAFLAGADVILFPASVKNAFEGLLGAARAGRLGSARLDESVRRILQAKAGLGLHRNPPPDLFQLDRFVGDPQDERSAQSIMEAALTLVRDRDRHLPLSPQARHTVLLLTVLDELRVAETRGEAFVREFRTRHPNTVHFQVRPELSGHEIDLIGRLARRMDQVVIGAYVRIAAYKGRIALSPNQVELLQGLSAIDRPLAFVLFGNPYVLPTVPDLPTSILAYDDYPGAEVAAVKAILGAVPFRGRLPVSIPDLYPLGHGILR